MHSGPDISVITVTKNSARTIARAVRSVAAQEGVSVQHIIKDAGSDDKTLEVANTEQPGLFHVTQPDTGIYDAMNQGFAASTGDVVAFLNSDDYYADRHVLADVVKVLGQRGCDFAYGDINMRTASGRLVRVWKVGGIPAQGLRGGQLPHPAFFVRRHVLDGLAPPFDPSYRIAADLKQQLLIINKRRLNGVYLNRVLTVMETGGRSTASIASYLAGWRESVRACNEVMGSGGVRFVARKVLSKVSGLRVIDRPAQDLPD